MMFRKLLLSDSRLERMLIDDPDRFEKVITKYPSIADRFDNDANLFSSGAREALREAFAPPADLTERLNARITSVFDAPSASATAFDLLGLGLATVKELTKDDSL
jgi:hypothetical protein